MISDEELAKELWAAYDESVEISKEWYKLHSTTREGMLAEARKAKELLPAKTSAEAELIEAALFWRDRVNHYGGTIEGAQQSLTEAADKVRAERAPVKPYEAFGCEVRCLKAGCPDGPHSIGVLNSNSWAVRVAGLLNAAEEKP